MRLRQGHNILYFQIRVDSVALWRWQMKKKKKCSYLGTMMTELDQNFRMCYFLFGLSTDTHIDSVWWTIFEISLYNQWSSTLGVRRAHRPDKIFPTVFKPSRTDEPFDLQPGSYIHTNIQFYFIAHSVWKWSIEIGSK